MKALFWIGLVVLILGIASLAVPIPHTNRESLTIGDVSIGVEAKHEEKVSPALTAAMIPGGLGAMVVGRRTAS